MDNDCASCASGGGNTKPHRSKDTAGRRWCLTIFNEDIDIVFEELCKLGKCVLGLEYCPSTMKKHIQGYINLDKKKRFSTLKNLLPWDVHIECARGNDVENFNYCSKDGKYLTNMDVPRKIIIKPLFAEWQFELEEKLKTEPDDRTIHWYWSCCGGVGKSLFTRYMYGKNEKKCVIINKGKYADMMNQMFMIDCEYIDTVIIDVPRSMKNISYSALESIKDGIITNSKYETGTKLIPFMHVVIFCNFEPELDEFSKDRYIVKKLCNCENPIIDI